MKTILLLLLTTTLTYANEFKCEISEFDQITDSSHKVNKYFDINDEQRLLDRAGALYTCQKEGMLISYWQVFGRFQTESLKIVESFSDCEVKDQVFYADGHRTCEESKSVAVSQCITAGFSLSKCQELSRNFYTVSAPDHAWGGDYCAVYVIGSCK